MERNQGYGAKLCGEIVQGFEEGHTLPCFPLRGPGASLRGASGVRDTDVDRREVSPSEILPSAANNFLIMDTTHLCISWHACIAPARIDLLTPGWLFLQITPMCQPYRGMGGMQRCQDI